MMDDTDLRESAFQVPFRKQSVNLLVSPTNSGKSYFLRRVVENRQFYFQVPEEITRLLVISCNPSVDTDVWKKELETEDCPVECINIDDYIEEENVEPGAIVIVEDISKLCPKILNLLNVFTHHLNLSALFLVTQGVLGAGELFRLVTYAHNLIIFFASSSNARLIKYFKSTFLFDADLKSYLEEIISFAEKNSSISLFELNQVSGENKTKFTAIVNLPSLFEETMNMNRPGLIFPRYNEMDEYNERFGENYVEMPENSPKLPSNAFVLVPAANVIRKQDAAKKLKCAAGSEESQWDDVVNSIEEQIDISVPMKKRLIAKNLLMYILKSKQFDFSEKVIMLRGNPKTESSVLDFILTAIRQSGPAEQNPDKNYAAFVKVLLANHTPRQFIKNKSLLPHGNIKSVKRVKKDSVDPRIRSRKNY
jgi:hypothetical protein